MDLRVLAGSFAMLAGVACTPQAGAPDGADHGAHTPDVPKAGPAAPAPAPAEANAAFSMSDAVIYRPLGGRDVTAGFGTLRAGTEGVSVIGARTDIAGTVELHTHTMDDSGKMAMRRVEDFAVEAGGTRELRRGGDHMMFFAVSPDLPAKGETVDVTLSLRRDDGSVYEVVVPFRVTEFD